MIMHLSKADRATIGNARELLAETADVPDRRYPNLVARYEVITGELVRIIDHQGDDDEFAGSNVMRLLNAGWQIASQKLLDGRYEVVLTHAMGSGRGDSEDYLEVLSFAMINAGI